MLYAEIAVDTYQDPRKKLFTYQIPADLATQVAPGVQVTVPFGKRTAEGYVWQVSSQKPSFPTKPIQSVKKRIFSDKQIQLARWMAEHYLASPLECLRCQLVGKGERASGNDPDKIRTLLLVPYTSQVKIRALMNPAVLVGSRSAVFSQLPRLQKIILEEPENWNYKDERAPYYHATEVAQKRAELEGLEIELKYQTPRLEDIKAGAKIPKIKPVQIIDLSREKSAGNFTLISQPLERLLTLRKSTLVYVTSKELREEIADNFRKIGPDKNFYEIAGPEVFSIPGKRVSYAVWADVDTILNLPDFRAPERIVGTVSKLNQLAQTRVLLQTSSPENPLFKELASGQLESFYRRELQTRQKFSLPPFSTLVKLTYTSKSRIKTNLEAEKLYERLTANGKQRTAVEISPPYEPHAKAPGKAQLHLAIKTSQPGQLGKLLEEVDPKWKVEVDPESLL